MYCIMCDKIQNIGPHLSNWQMYMYIVAFSQKSGINEITGNLKKGQHLSFKSF